MRDKLGRFIGGHKYIGNGKEWFKKGIHPPTEFKKGQHFSPTTEFKKGEHLKEKHWNWKGGRIKNQQGYILILKPEHTFCDCKGYVREHRLVVEKQIGRYLLPKEVVHHCGEKDDNRPKMLMAFKNDTYHQWFHRKGASYSKGIIFDGRNIK